VSNERIRQREAARALLEALRRYRPEMLASLRGLPNDTEIPRWVSDNDLNGPSSIKAATELRQYWANNSHRAESLTIGGVTIILVGAYRPMSSEERAWVTAHCRAESGDRERRPRWSCCSTN
jgi:hypothetical protein